MTQVHQTTTVSFMANVSRHFHTSASPTSIKQALLVSSFAECLTFSDCVFFGVPHCGQKTFHGRACEACISKVFPTRSHTVAAQGGWAGLVLSCGPHQVHVHSHTIKCLNARTKYRRLGESNREIVSFRFVRARGLVA